ncbi:MAG: hypothetical protein ACXAB0_00015 [Candidatus Thorarchaeota archaeon]
MGLRDAITDYFAERPRAKKVLGIASAIAANVAMVGTGSAVLAVAAGSIVKAREDQTRVHPDQLIDFFKEAIQDPVVRDSLKEAVRDGGVPVAAPVATAMNQLGANAPETGQFVDTMKADLTVVMQSLGILQDMLSYYEIPDSQKRIMNVWRLPTYLDDVLVIEDARKQVIDAAVKCARDGDNAVILGAPGSGKTTAMYAIWKELDEEADTALVWDTKDVARTHEKDGVILFSDDIPESRELAKAIVERDVSGVVTTAREQDWSRLPIDLRSKFTQFNLPNISDEVMTDIVKKHLASQGISYEKKVLPTIVESAQGSPIYVRYLVEEIGSEIKSGLISKLTGKRLKTAPKGMTDYVAGILARILFELDGTIYKPRAGALPVIKTLLCLADMPNYETHEVHLNQMFFALKQPSDSPGPFNAFKQYLSRDPRFFSLKFMHDTLADVLRGKVDHPVVGDFRLVAQEMGVAGRRNIESQALNDGWEHVKAEYDVDKSGGLDLILAYSYFAAKNFGTDRIDPIALNLANQHLENPISQGLFALTGPITDVPVTKAEPQLVSTKTIPKDTTEAVPDSLEKLIRDRLGAAGEVKPDELAKELGNLEELKKLGDIGKIVEQAIESSMSASKEVSKTSFDLLEEALADETITPRRFSRRVLKACRRIMVLSDRGKLKDEKTKGDLIAAGIERMVKLDFDRYMEYLDLISDALAETLGEDVTSEILTHNFRNVTIDELDEKTRNKANGIYKKGMQRSVDLGNYTSIMVHLRNKWDILGFDSNDISFVSDEFGKLMKRGRAKLALTELEKLNSSFGENKFEVRIGVTLEAFKNLSKAPVRDRDHFNAIFAAALKLFEDLVLSIEKCPEDICKELVKSQPIADLCIGTVTGVISLMGNYIKRPGKSVSAVSVYPLLHESIRPLVTLALKTLKQNGDSKTIKSMKSAINKIRGESSAKEEMVMEAKSHFG